VLFSALSFKNLRSNFAEVKQTGISLLGCDALIDAFGTAAYANVAFLHVTHS